MSYQSTILADSPISYWELAETSGTTATDSAGSNNGTYTGGFTLNQTGFAQVAPSVLFNGSTGYISVPDATSLHLTSVSIEAWFKTTNSGNIAIINKSIATGGWGLSLNGGKIILYCSGSSGVTAQNSKNYNDGNWHYIVGTISSGGVVNIYADAILIFSETVTQSLSNTAALNIGRNVQNTLNFFNGNISNVAVYSSVLTQSQVDAHYAANTSTENLRATQVARRTLIQPSSINMRATQVARRTLIQSSSINMRATQVARRTLINATANARVSQVARRILVTTSTIVYPSGSILTNMSGQLDRKLGGGFRN